MRHARNTLTLCTAVGILLLPGCSNDEPSVASEPTPSPSESASPTATAGQPIPMASYEGPLAPGTYAVPTWGYADEPGDTWPLAVVDVPSGYHSPGGWVVDAGGEGEPDEYGSLAFWYAEEVVSDPCNPDDGTEKVGAGVRDLAMALVRQKGNRTSSVMAVDIGGHAGFHLTVRADKSCEGLDPALWAWGDDYFTLDRNADVTHLWILDVDGRRMIMAVGLYPGQPAVVADELLTMAKGVRFVAPSDL